MSTRSLPSCGCREPTIWSCPTRRCTTLGNLGKLGIIPDYPGEDVYPLQPMMSQMRWFLDQYAAGGGQTTEAIIEGAGHGPHIDHPAEFQAALHAFLSDASG